MKSSSQSRFVLIGALAACLVVCGRVLAGSLTPPGPPAPTMKTLDQVEARTPISSLPYTISMPGSYYLTGNLQGVSGSDGIKVTADNVSIDLNGFALVGVTGALTGINAGSASPYPNNLTVRGGTIRDWANGIEAPNSLNLLFQDLVVAANTTYGIDGGSGMISHVLARGNSYGITLRDPTGGTVKDCVAIDNSSIGIFVYYNTLVVDNQAFRNNDGIYVLSSGNKVDSNHVVTNSSYGIVVNAVLNVIIRNTAINSGLSNYHIAAGSDVGPIGTAAAATSPWANISD
jgi:parallel beta-helix repeat protein